MPRQCGPAWWDTIRPRRRSTQLKSMPPRRRKSGNSYIVASESRSFSKGSVDSIELPEQRGPFHNAIGPARLRLIVAPRFLENGLRHADELRIACHRVELRTAGELEPMRPIERFGDRPADDERSMVSQDQGFAAAQITNQRLLFVELQHDAPIVVVADFQKSHRRLRDGQQAAFHRRYRHRRCGMHMNDAVNVRARGVNGAMNDEARLIDAIVEL